MEPGNKIVKPGLNGILRGENGEKVSPPAGWAFLAAGDAGLTRKVTAQGIFWRVQAQMGRRIISKGIWRREKRLRWPGKRLRLFGQRRHTRRN